MNHSFELQQTHIIDSDSVDGITIAKTVAAPEVIMAVVESRGLIKHIGYASIDFATCRCYMAQVF